MLFRSTGTPVLIFTKLAIAVLVEDTYTENLSLKPVSTGGVPEEFDVDAFAQNLTTFVVPSVIFGDINQLLLTGDCCPIVPSGPQLIMLLFPVLAVKLNAGDPRVTIDGTVKAGSKT